MAFVVLVMDVRSEIVDGHREPQGYPIRYDHPMATKYPVTMAIRALRAAEVAFEPHVYSWEPRGGTRASAAALGVDEHHVIKTLIFEDDHAQPRCILMHGDREVSAKQLARVIGARSVGPCAPAVADRHSGYQVGGTSPFGLKRAMPIYMERTIAALSRIYINGGARGLLVSIDPRDAERVLSPTLVDVAV
jgi:Cys-tRNA(Pro) deacylase